MKWNLMVLRIPVANAATSILIIKWMYCYWCIIYVNLKSKNVLFCNNLPKLNSGKLLKTRCHFKLWAQILQISPLDVGTPVTKIRSLLGKDNFLHIIFLYFLSSLIDCFLLDSAVVSLTMSPTGDFLATAHVDDLGIYLWYVLYPLMKYRSPLFKILPAICNLFVMYKYGHFVRCRWPRIMFTFDLAVTTFSAKSTFCYEFVFQTFQV